MAEPVFVSKVAGATYHNADGSHRQAVIACCEVGEVLLLVRDVGNERDPSAVAVCRRDGAQLGFINQKWSGGLAGEMDEGGLFYAVITDLTGGTPENPPAA